MTRINLDEFHGLKCSRPHCGGEAEIYEDYDVVEIRCRVCANRQVLLDLFAMCEECHEAEIGA